MIRNVIASFVCLALLLADTRLRRIVQSFKSSGTGA